MRQGENKREREQMEVSEWSLAWNEGWEAAMANKPVDSNPYSVQDDERFNGWDAGYEACEIYLSGEESLELKG